MDKQISSLNDKEFSHIAQSAAANAARSLEMIADNSLSLEVLTAGTCPTFDIETLADNPEDITVGAYVKVNGSIPGHALLLFPRASALTFSDLVLNREDGTTTELGELEESLIQEVANILISSYITAIADHYQIILLPEPPLIATDMAAAIIDEVLTNSGQYSLDTVNIVTRFRRDTDSSDGVFLYIPESDPFIESEAS